MLLGVSSLIPVEANFFVSDSFTYTVYIMLCEMDAEVFEN